MLNMGFLEDVQFVLSNTPEKRQIALFSATMPGPIREIAEKYLNDPVKVTVRKQTLTADSITQKCVFVNERNKLDLLARIMEIETTDGVIVFTKTKDSTVAVAERLAKLGLSAAALNGDLPQTRRQRTVDQLKAGQLDIVVATDVAARGLDVQRISHVFNYDLPHDSESYVHRIGRTGRAGRAGTAYIFLTPAQRGKLRYIENATRKPIEVVLAPTARQVNEKRLSDFKEQVITTAQRKKLRKPFQRVVAECIEESGLTAEEVAAAIAAVANADRPFVAGDIPEPDLRRGRPDSRPPRGDRRGSSGARPARRGMKRYRIEVGSSDGVKPGNIVGAIANEAGIAGCDIGAISIQDSYSTVDLPEEVTPNIANQLSRTWVAGKQLRLRPVGDYDDAGDNRRGGQSRWQSGGKKGGKPFAKRKGPGKPFKSGGKKPGGKKSFRPAK
jgi:ATP-dependent RNA helicase DeaD